MKDLPSELKQLIYNRLDGKSRCKLRIALSKTKLRGSKDHEARITSAENYIQRHKSALHAKDKLLPGVIQTWLVDAASDDVYARTLLQDAGLGHCLPVTGADADAGTDAGTSAKQGLPELTNVGTLMLYIQYGRLTQALLADKIRDASQLAFADPQQELQFCNTVAEHCTPAIFDILLAHPVTHALVVNNVLFVDGFGCIAIKLINYKNEALLAHLLSDEFKHNEQCQQIHEQIQQTIQDTVTRKYFICIFVSDSGAVELLLKYFGHLLPVEAIEQMLDRAEENLYCESAHLIAKFLKTRLRAAAD